MSTVHQELSNRIKDRIITMILESPLNVDFIPDDIERELYHNILSAVEEVLEKPSFWQNVKTFLKQLISRCKCCKKTDLNSPSIEEDNSQ